MIGGGVGYGNIKSVLSKTPPTYTFHTTLKFSHNTQIFTSQIFTNFHPQSFDFLNKIW